MKKSILNAIILTGALSVATASHAVVFTCPTLQPHEIYFYLDWVDSDGAKIGHGAWNQGYWRLWINGDSYLTPKDTAVHTSPLTAHFFESTNSWYLKCTSADLSVGPRTNVWTYGLCKITPDNTGFECK